MPSSVTLVSLCELADLGPPGGGNRVLYRIEDDVLTVVVVHAGHRREVYDR